ncbi:MAG: Lrp/AsnC ligand binding domain-containing protein [Candidatus Bathyarchaeia archaeon]
MSSQIIAYILLVTEVGKEHEVIQELLKIKGVVEARTVYGEFDVVCRIELDSLRSLDESVTRARKVQGIIRTVTLISG